MWVLLPKKGTIMNPGIGESQHKVIWQRRVGMLKMHDNEVETDASLVGRLLTTQFPQWAQLPVIPVASAGTDNALYRLGMSTRNTTGYRDWPLCCLWLSRSLWPRGAPAQDIRGIGRFMSGSQAKTQRWTASPIHTRRPLTWHDS